jgi:hypothetical protein
MSPMKNAPAGLTTDDTALRAQYLAEVLHLLYPDTDQGPSPAAGELVAEYLIVPHARSPRLLVPAADRRIAAAAVARYAEATSRTAQLKRYAVIAALRTGASRALLRDRVNITVPEQRTVDSIETYLAKVLGGSLSVSIHIGPARANRKPVLQLLAPNGDTVGFGKLGVGPLTRALVRQETDSLRTVGQADLTRLSVPRVLHAGQWRGNEVLVQSALPIWLPRATLTTNRLVAAMREVAACGGTHTAPLAADPYWHALRDRLDGLRLRAEDGVRADGTVAADEIRTLALAADELIAGVGQTELAFGSWHGDWTPWNMATTADSVLVWDWERFVAGVPMGFDALHFDLQRLLTRGVDAGAAVDTTTGRAHRLLAPFEVQPAAAHVTALLYLVDLATRYLEDRQAEAGARLGVLGRWLLPVLTRKVAEL